MGHRLSKITTKTGDQGTTGLGDGSRVAKHDLRIAAIGEVDELNSVLGLLLTEPLPDDLRELLTDIQHHLFDLGGELSIPGYAAIGEAHVARLERAIEELNAELPLLADFILPGGSRPAALAHFVRTVARRAERAVVALAFDASSGGVAEPLRIYLNRLSDLAFVLARTLNRRADVRDVLWQKGRT